MWSRRCARSRSRRASTRRIGSGGPSSPTAGGTSPFSAGTSRPLRPRCGPGRQASTFPPGARRSSSPTAKPPSTGRRCRAPSRSFSRAAGIEFGLMSQQWCCGGPMWETGYVDVAHKMAEHNMLDWRKTGTKKDHLPRPARLHHDHRALPAARRELRRVRDRPRRRSRRRAHPRRKDRADDADRAHRHVPRPVPAEQAPRQMEVPAGDPAGDSGAHVRRRRPRHAVVVLLRRGREPRRREAGADRRDQPPASRTRQRRWTA